ncbi:MAG: M28 family peptidase [Candidatus Flexifilum sp.]
MSTSALTLTDRLIAHVRALSDDLGPRPAASRAERRAADYVREQLMQRGLSDIREETFPAPSSPGMAVIPYLAGAALALPLSWTGRAGKLLGGGLLLGALFNVREFLLGKAPLYAPLVTTGESRNVWVRIPAAGAARRTLYLIAHLDTGKQRFMAPQIVPTLTRPLTSALLTLGMIGGLSLLIDGLAGRRRTTPLHNLVGLTAAGGVAALFYDETQPYVDGANSNASGVAALIELAGQLAAQPLAHTDVVVLFTGAAQTLNTGLEAFLSRHSPPLETSVFVVVQSVGIGELAFARRAGLSNFTEYRPSPRIMAAAARVARSRPELRIGTVDITLLDETLALRRRGWEAIALVGHERGLIPHWNRLTDTADRVQGETLRRAVEVVGALAAELDR